MSPHDPKVAVFYSISLACKGLTGIDLGNFLIKQVAQRIMVGLALSDLKQNNPASASNVAV